MDDTLRGRFPVLYDFLTLTGVGGHMRTTATANVFAEDGKWKCCLNDRDGSRYAFVSADTLERLLEALEGGLKRGTLDWRVSKWRK